MRVDTVDAGETIQHYLLWLYERVKGDVSPDTRAEIGDIVSTFKAFDEYIERLQAMIEVRESDADRHEARLDSIESQLHDLERKVDQLEHTLWQMERGR